MAKSKKTTDNRHHLPLREDTEILDPLVSEAKIACALISKIEKATSVLNLRLSRIIKVKPIYAKRLIEMTYTVDPLLEIWLKLTSLHEALLPKFDDEDDPPSKTAKLDRSTR